MGQRLSFQLSIHRKEQGVKHVIDANDTVLMALTGKPAQHLQKLGARANIS